jgi:hypothetical protein
MRLAALTRASAAYWALRSRIDDFGFGSMDGPLPCQLGDRRRLVAFELGDEILFGNGGQSQRCLALMFAKTGVRGDLFAG